ncbi:MAG: hypothetical protein AAFZ65_20935, partial [Planctomycetota bacterium]
MATSTSLPADSAPTLESFQYDDAIVRKFSFATILWGVVGMLVGLLLALQLALPALEHVLADDRVVDQDLDR